MPPDFKHLRHLSQILSENDPSLSPQTLTNDFLDDFFRSVASDRIRIDRYDWQGHPVQTLLD